MSYDDILFQNYTNSIRLAVEEKTSFKAGQNLVAAGRQFVRDACEDYPDLIENENAINYTLTDIIGYFSDNDVNFDWKDLATLLLLDKELFFFIKDMVDGKTEFSDVWEHMSDYKKDLVYKSIQVSISFFLGEEV